MNREWIEKISILGECVRSLSDNRSLTVWKRKFVYTTIDSKHNLPVLDNALNRQFDTYCKFKSRISR